MPKKLTIEYVKAKTKEIAEDYECLSNEYVNNSTKLKFQCNREHIFFMGWASFQQGIRCPYCAGNAKKNIEEIREYIELFGYKCLSNIYVNAHTKLKIQCDKGHIYKAEWAAFQQGQRCPICAIENKSGENNYRWKNYTEEDRKNIESYKAEVTQLSRANFKKYYYIINPLNHKLGKCKYHLDHIYSIIDGFNNNVPPKIIASPVNLQMLWYSDNIVKRDNSAMTLKQLYFLYNQFKECDYEWLKRKRSGFLKI